MIKIYTDEEFAEATENTMLKLKCTKCNKEFERRKFVIERGINLIQPAIKRTSFCSPNCAEQAPES